MCLHGIGLGFAHSHQINLDRCKHQNVLFKYFYNIAYNIMKVLEFVTAPLLCLLELL